MSVETGSMIDEMLEEGTGVGLASEYLAFISYGLRFVVNAADIMEIIMNHAITDLPCVPDFIRGIINLRGQIIPVVDVRLRLDGTEAEYTEEACIIVMDVALPNDGQTSSIGLLVEKVSHVVNIRDEQISPAPRKNKQEIVSAMAHVDGIDYLMIDCASLIDSVS